MANWDAAIDHGRGRLGLGVVLHDHARKTLAAQCFTRLGHLEPADAKVMAALDAT